MYIQQIFIKSMEYMSQTWKVQPKSKFIGEYCPDTIAEYKKRVWHANDEIFMNIKDTVRPCNIELEKLLKWANIVFFVYSMDDQKSFRSVVGYCRQLVKWGASSRWSFGPNFAWESIETTAIVKTHSTLPSWIPFQVNWRNLGPEYSNNWSIDSQEFSYASCVLCYW